MATLSARDLRDIADGLRVAAASLENEAREVGADSYRFEYIVGRAARFRRLRQRALRQTA